MKKLLFAVSAIIFITCISCNEKTDVTKEKEAVLKVLQEEGDAFAANDLDRLSVIYIQDSTQTRLAQGPDAVSVYKGWSALRQLYEDYFKLNSTDSSWVNPKNTKENVIIKVAGNSAWVLCDNIWDYDYQNVHEKQTNMQIAFLEKINGEWKISFDAFIQKPEPDPVKAVSEN
jgi:ketosteroid isomerase-like protein